MSYDDLDYPPSLSRAGGWLAGVLMPACLAAYAITGLYRDAVYLPGRRGAGMMVSGDLAIWLSLAYMSIAAIAHFQFFWGSQSKLWRYRPIFVPVSLAFFCACLGRFTFLFLSR